MTVQLTPPLHSPSSSPPVVARRLPQYTSTVSLQAVSSTSSMTSGGSTGMLLGKGWRVSGDVGSSRDMGDVVGTPARDWAAVVWVYMLPGVGEGEW